MYVLVELAFTYQTIVALSAKLTKVLSNRQSACWMSSAYLHSIFIGALRPPPPPPPPKIICGTSGKIISLK